MEQCKVHVVVYNEHMYRQCKCQKLSTHVADVFRFLTTLTFSVEVCRS